MPAKIEFDLRKLDRSIKKAAARGFDFKPAFRKVRGAFRKDQKQHIKDQKNAKGSKWKGLSPETIDKRMRMGGRAGKFTKRGKLRKSAQRKLGRILSAKLVSGAKVKLTPKRMKITSKVPWAGAHQKGKRVGRGARLPKRQFMWVSDTFGQQAADAMIQAVIEAWNSANST